MDTQLVFNSFDPRGSISLHEFFEAHIDATRKLAIAVGYISEQSIRYLLQRAEELPDLEIELVCGMHFKEGMTKRQLKSTMELHQFLKSNNRGAVYLTPRLPYHGKLYIFTKEEGLVTYAGSGNLSAIVRGYSETCEIGFGLSPAPRNVQEYFDKHVMPIAEPIDTVKVKIIPPKDSPMSAVEEALKVELETVTEIFDSPAEYTIHIPLKAEPKSSLNAHLGGGGARTQKSGRNLQRNWYEGELIVGKKYRDLEGYPAPGSVFHVVTDDGWSFDCKISGQGGKNLRSKGKLSTFGTWLKSRLVEAGALNYGEIADQDTIRQFGRSYLTMKYRPLHQVWTFDLSVNEDTPWEIPDNV